MKIKTAVTAILLSSVFAIGASGCSITDFSADNLLRPPKAIGDEADIEQLISENAKNNYTLKYPKNGNYRSAIIMADLNNDKKDEAIAFYRNSDDTTIMHMLVMYNNSEQWKISSDNIIEATDIDRVDFADINDNKTLEIIAGYTTYTPNINKLACYSYSEGKTLEIKSGHSYSSFYCSDFDSDGGSEVMTLLLYTTENEAAASMLDFSEDNNSLYARSMVNMDPNVIKYKNVSVAEFENNIYGLFVDGSYANEEINTQLIYYSKELSLLRNPLFKEKTRNITQRNRSVICKDSDDDGLTEIPLVTKLPHSKNEPEDMIADKIMWNSFAAGTEGLRAKLGVISNPNYNYYFKIPEKWNENLVTAIIDRENNSSVFCEWKQNKTGSVLFEIRTFTVEDWNNGKTNDKYTLISKNDKYAYAYINTNADSPVSLTDNEIKTGFVLLPDAAEQSAN